MAKYLCVGLRELQYTYKSGTTVGTLQYYIIVLTAVIDDTFYPEMLYNAVVSGRKSFLDEDNDEAEHLIYSTIFDVGKFKTFWSKEELKSLCEQFDKCFKSVGEIDNVIFKDTDLEYDECAAMGQPSGNLSGRPSPFTLPVDITDTPNYSTTVVASVIPQVICPISLSKEDGLFDLDDGGFAQEQLIDLASEHSATSFTEKKAAKTHRKDSRTRNRDSKVLLERGNVMRTWPVPKSLGNVIVQSHLVGINNILNIMDKKFTTMLNQSVKGTH